MNENITHIQKTSLVSGRILGICLALVVVVLLAVAVFKVPLSTVGFAAVLLACPLMHILMMKNGGHDH